MQVLSTIFSVFLELIMSTKLEEERRKEEEKKFLDLCSEGDLESVKTFLAEDPSLINSTDPEHGKLLFSRSCTHRNGSQINCVSLYLHAKIVYI